jgi:hypothetical protein
MDKTVDNKELTFLEKIILLGLDDKGWFSNSEHRIKFGLAGALLFELYVRGKITLDGTFLKIEDQQHLDDVVLNRVLSLITNGKKPRTLKNWIQRIVMKKLLIRKTVIKSLLEKKILKKEEYSLLWVMYQFKYPVIDTQVKQSLRQEMYDKILGGGALSDHDLMLVSVMENCRMIRKNFHGFENYSKLRRNIREITQFENPANERIEMIRQLHSATSRSIMASNVSIHA